MVDRQEILAALQVRRFLCMGRFLPRMAGRALFKGSTRRLCTETFSLYGNYPSEYGDVCPERPAQSFERAGNCGEV